VQVYNVWPELPDGPLEPGEGGGRGGQARGILEKLHGREARKSGGEEEAANGCAIQFLLRQQPPAVTVRDDKRLVPRPAKTRVEFAHGGLEPADAGEIFGCDDQDAHLDTALNPSREFHAEAEMPCGGGLLGCWVAGLLGCSVVGCWLFGGITFWLFPGHRPGDKSPGTSTGRT